MKAFGIDVDASCIRMFPAGASKQDVLDALIDAVALYDGIEDKRRFQASVYQRESVMSTGIGDGVAIPHVRFEGVGKPALGVGISAEGIDFGTLDGQPVHIIVLFAMPAGAQREYLDLLAQVMVALKKPGFRDMLEACKTPAEVLSVLCENP